MDRSDLFLDRIVVRNAPDSKQCNCKTYRLLINYLYNKAARFIVEWCGVTKIIRGVNGKEACSNRQEKHR